MNELSELEKQTLEKVKLAGKIYLSDLTVQEQGSIGKLVPKKLVIVSKDYILKKKYIEEYKEKMIESE